MEGGIEGVPLRNTSTAQVSRRSTFWHVFGRQLPKTEVVFFFQIILIYLIVGVSLFNLSRQTGPDHLWIALLSSCVGYSLPNPAINPKI